MLLLKISIWGTSQLGRARLELLAFEAISVSSFGRKLLWLSASGKTIMRWRLRASLCRVLHGQISRRFKQFDDMHSARPRTPWYRL